MMPVKKSFFAQDTVKAAKRLLGKIIRYKDITGRIVETEAYKGFPDEASHACKKTARSAIMYESYGKIYVYFIYGNYYCLNLTTEKGKPGAVLIRALQPLSGIKKMAKRRGINIGNIDVSKQESLVNLTNGPGKLCQALGITKELNDTTVGDKIKILNSNLTLRKSDIAATSRIGITKAQHLKWRFYIKNNNFVSKRENLAK